MRLKRPKQSRDLPGLVGELEFRAQRAEHAKPVTHRGPARLVEAEAGAFLFIDLTTGIPVWLNVSEVVSFTTMTGAS